MTNKFTPSEKPAKEVKALIFYQPGGDSSKEDIMEGRSEAVVAWIFAAAFIVMMLLCVSCFADEIPKARFVNAIIGEAEGEPYIGKLAVACSIRERGSLKGVYGEKAPRVLQHKYSPKVFVDAIKAYEESANPVNCEFIEGSTHWEGTSFKTPYWAKRMIIVKTIANQTFYREK